MGVAGAEDDHGAGEVGHDAPGRVDAADRAEVDVHQHQRGPQLSGPAHRPTRPTRRHRPTGTRRCGRAPTGPPNGTGPGRRPRGRRCRSCRARGQSDPRRPPTTRVRRRWTGVWPASPPGSAPASSRYSRTAFTRRLTSRSSLRPSFEKIELVCFSTARSDSTSAAAMAALLLPWAISPSTSRSRGREPVDLGAPGRAVGRHQALDDPRVDDRAAERRPVAPPRPGRRPRPPAPSAGRPGRRRPPSSRARA